MAPLKEGSEVDEECLVKARHPSIVLSCTAGNNDFGDGPTPTDSPLDDATSFAGSKCVILTRYAGIRIG